VVRTGKQTFTAVRWGVLALNDGRNVLNICGVPQVCVAPVCNWARAWQEWSLAEMGSGHDEGASRKLSAQLLGVSAEMARQEPRPP
jgi:hypothetical protein